MILGEALSALQSDCETGIQRACDYFRDAPHRDAIPLLVEQFKQVSNPELKESVLACLKYLSENTPSLRDPYGVFRL